MNKIETLVGMSVEVVVENYTVRGVLEVLDKEKIIVRGEENFFIIFKDKISLVSFPIPGLEKQPEETPVQKIQRPTEKESAFQQNDIAEKNQYGSVLPITLLEQQPEDPYDRIFQELDSYQDNDFSIAMGTFNDEEKLLSRSDRMKILDKGKRNDSSK